METQVLVIDPAGLHARPAAAIAAVAARQTGRVLLTYGGADADARSVLEIMSLGAPSGAIVTVRTPEDTPRESMEAIVDVVRSSGAGSLDLPTEQIGDTPPPTISPDTARPIWSHQLLTHGGCPADALEAIKYVGEALVETGAVTNDYLAAVVAREQELPTGVPGDPPFAIAHADGTHVKRLSVAIGVLEKPVIFQRMDDPSEQLSTRLVCVLAVPSGHGHAQTLKRLIRLLANADISRKLLSTKSAQQMWDTLASHEPDLVKEDSLNQGKLTRDRLRGIAVSSGIAVAPALRVVENGTHETSTGDVEAERRQLRDTIYDAAAAWSSPNPNRVPHDFTPTKDDDTDDTASMLQMYATLIQDPALISFAETAISAGLSYHAALIQAGDEAAALLERTGNPYLAARGDDMRGVARAAANLRASKETGVPDGAQIILIGRGLTLLDMPFDVDVVGIVDAVGSSTAHLAMIARAKGIPAVFDVGDITGLTPGTLLAVDGWTGHVLPNPDDAALDELQKIAQVNNQKRIDTKRLAQGVIGTNDGHPVEFAANAASIQEIQQAMAEGAASIGLLRTELAFGGRSTTPSLSDHIAFFRSAIESTQGHGLIVRTFDFGSDKPARFLTLPPETNPALGIRGFRLRHIDQELISIQVQALAKVVHETGARNVGVMAPMIATASEAEEFSRLVRSHDPDRLIQVGVMIEIPAAVLAAPEVVHHLDFVSIGTNDLRQYLFAADRMQTLAGGSPTESDVALLRAVDMICKAAGQVGAWVGVCGELASDPEWAVQAVGLGVSELSTRIDRLDTVKAAIGNLSIVEARELAERTLSGGGGTHG